MARAKSCWSCDAPIKRGTAICPACKKTFDEESKIYFGFMDRLSEFITSMQDRASEEPSSAQDDIGALVSLFAEAQTFWRGSKVVVERSGLAGKMLEHVVRGLLAPYETLVVADEPDTLDLYVRIFAWHGEIDRFGFSGPEASSEYQTVLSDSMKRLILRGRFSEAVSLMYLMYLWLMMQSDVDTWGGGADFLFMEILPGPFQTVEERFESIEERFESSQALLEQYDSHIRHLKEESREKDEALSQAKAAQQRLDDLRGVQDALLQEVKDLKRCVADPSYRQTVRIEGVLESFEDVRVERKSSLRWDVKRDCVNADLEFAVIKAIAGFANAEGGCLVIGQADDGAIVGLEADFATLNGGGWDAFVRRLTESVSTSLSPILAKRIRLHRRTRDGKCVCIVSVPRGTAPIFLKKGDEQQFYVRYDASTRQLQGKDLLDYANSRAARRSRRAGHVGSVQK